MRQNTSHDEDPIYDYFYVETPITMKALNQAANKELIVEHSLPYFYEDSIIDWGPEGTTRGTSFSVSLPWGVSWNFTTGSSVNIETVADTIDEIVTWTVGDKYSLSDLPATLSIKPGTAWASGASAPDPFGNYVVGLDTNHTSTIAIFIGGANQAQLHLSEEVTYLYQ